MKKKYITVTVIFAVILTVFYFAFLDSEQTHNIGRVQVKGLPNIYFELEQENEFDMATAIYYGISENSNKLIAPMKFLIGTHDYIKNTDNFSANSVDSIIFLTWGETNEVYAVYNLKTGDGHPSRKHTWSESIVVADNLIHKLRKKNPYLKANWKR